MEGQKNRDGGRIDECRHSGRAGERCIALFFFLSLFLFFFSQWQGVTSSSAIWRECHATLPLSSPQTLMKFYLLCHAVEKKQFFCSLINVWFVGRQYTRMQESFKEDWYTFFSLGCATCINQTVDRLRVGVSWASSLWLSCMILFHWLAEPPPEETAISYTHISAFWRKWKCSLCGKYCNSLCIFCPMNYLGTNLFLGFFSSQCFHFCSVVSHCTLFHAVDMTNLNIVVTVWTWSYVQILLMASRCICEWKFSR